MPNVYYESGPVRKLWNRIWRTFNVIKCFNIVKSGISGKYSTIKPGVIDQELNL